MKRIAFVDHFFHKASRSSDFFKELLSREYSVTLFFDETWGGGSEADIIAINAGNFDAVVFWQSLPLPLSILRLKCRNLIWIPMFDSEWNRANLAWHALAALGMKVVCFSNGIFEAAQRNGVDSHLVQYFPEIPAESVNYDAPRLFFWQRTDFLTWAQISRILAGNHIESSVLKDDPDPDHVFSEPGASDIEQFNIKILRNMRIASGGRREDYLRILAGCNIFIAPRLREGIGLSFLEAMSMGMCVVGADLPTLSEYVKSGEEGYLFDPEHLSPLDISGFAQCGARARMAASEGRQKWLDGIPSLMKFIALTTETRRSRLASVVVLLWAAASAVKLRYEQMFHHRTA
jgi:hypothetical protein